MFRLLTPGGGRVGGVAVLAVEGSDRRARAAEVLQTLSGAPLVPDECPRVARLMIHGQCVDEALVFDVPERSAVEIHVHGSPAVLAAVGVDGSAQVRHQGRELSCAERLVREALDDGQLALGLEQMAGPSWGEFLDSVAAMPLGYARDSVIAAARARSRVALAVATPVEVALCGVQNAGKSTLLNRLLLRERAVTGPVAGLTRDPVEDTAVLGGYPYRVVDTAGEGAVEDGLDRAALDLARLRQEQAGYRVLVVDLTRMADSEQLAALPQLHRPGSTVVVLNKQDLVGPEASAADQLPRQIAESPTLSVSCADAADGPRLRAELGAMLARIRELPGEPGAVGGTAALSLAALRELDGLAAEGAPPPEPCG